ncbi:hypothetical protein COMA2_40034 [Candidatus Nitrospira nitrificans]|uniref:Uncharacterized protein n=1 Tax=Candidatus Nitrospira nitrificans TaxID=1742973 RepID=A0A0S4LJR8_9BACT|nr:hypothetical protein COMA2_40034 [Candidatus Nitrospira nitrificans]
MRDATLIPLLSDRGYRAAERRGACMSYPATANIHGRDSQECQAHSRRIWNEITASGSTFTR